MFNFEPPTSPDEVHAAALQYVRKVSGFTKPSLANQAVFDAGIAEVAAATSRLLASLETQAPPRNREAVAARARLRWRTRTG